MANWYGAGMVRCHQPILRSGFRWGKDGSWKRTGQLVVSDIQFGEGHQFSD